MAGRRVKGLSVCALTLAGLLDQRGLRCGSINSHCPNDVDGADLTWHSAVLPGEEALPGLADVFADWLLAESRRPVPELVARRKRFELGG